MTKKTNNHISLTNEDSPVDTLIPQGQYAYLTPFDQWKVIYWESTSFTSFLAFGIITSGRLANDTSAVDTVTALDNKETNIS